MNTIAEAIVIGKHRNIGLDGKTMIIAGLPFIRDRRKPYFIDTVHDFLRVVIGSAVADF